MRPAPRQTLPFCLFFHPVLLCRQRCRSGAGDHERDDSEGDGGKRLFVSDHGDECVEELRSDGIAGGVNGEQRDGVDLGYAYGGGILGRDAERDQ